MKKIIFESLVSITLFFGIWYVAGLGDWVKWFHVEEISQKTEEKWGEWMEKILNEQFDIIHNETITQPIQKLFNHLCETNQLRANDYTLHIVEDEEVNAFALPGGHIVVFSGLLIACNNESALAGVLGHELAHITQNHVSRKMIQDIGLTAIIGSTQQNSGELIKTVFKALSSSAYSRNLEKEADLQSVLYLHQAGFTAEPFANLLKEIEQQKEGPLPAWVQSHPDGEARAGYILQAEKKGNVQDQNTVISSAEWEEMKEGMEH